MFVYGRNVALSFEFTNENDEYLHKKVFQLCFCLLYTSFSGKHKTSYCPKVVRDRTDVVGLELYVGDSLENVGDFSKNVGDFLKNVGVFWKTLGENFQNVGDFFARQGKSEKEAEKGGESDTLARVTRARITEIFVFLLSQPSHNR